MHTPAITGTGVFTPENVITNAEGKPALVDPACYWGWAEAELAMTDLFGGFPEAFYSHYKECSDLADDWRERVPLYNLYHLLNHLILFGSSYYTPVKTILNRFADC